MPKLLEERKRGTGAASAALLESLETPLYPSVDTVGFVHTPREGAVREVMCVFSLHERMAVDGLKSD